MDPKKVIVSCVILFRFLTAHREDMEEYEVYHNIEK